MSPSNRFTEDQLLPLSYLNDYLFCDRRAAMHLLEQTWKDNQFTAEGQYAHRKVDQAANRKRDDKRNVTGMMLVSYELGVTGKADLVEFRDPKPDECSTAADAFNPTCNGLVPFPVDFKRGKKRRWDNDEVQLCAQALCLEEMLNVDVPAGAIFHIRSQHRREVVFADTLRQQTIDTAARLHDLVGFGVTPPAVWKARCKGCSLLELCMPKAWRKSSSKYLLRLQNE